MRTTRILRRIGAQSAARRGASEESVAHRAAGLQGEDFLTGFVVNDSSVWGRPVGVAVGKDGSLFVTDDGSRTIWRFAYTGK